MNLLDALQECTLALLRRIAASHEVAVREDTLRGELVLLVAQRIAEPDYLAGYLETLPDEEVEELQAVAASGWTAKAFVMERLFHRRGGDAVASASTPDSSPSLSLLHKGLLFRGFAPVEDWRGEVYYVPEELRPSIALLPPKAIPEKEPDLRPAAIPEIVEARDGVFDVFCLLSFLRREDRRTSQGFIARSDLAKLEAEARPRTLREENARPADRWRFLLHLCLAGGWVVRQGNTLKPGRGAAGLLAGGRDRARARLLQRYLKDRSWSDLAEAGRVRQVLGGRIMDEPAARRLLLHHLGELAVRDWIDERAFCVALRSANPDLLREDYASPAWAVVEVVSDVEIYGPSSWETVEGEWIRFLLGGPLRWLGAVRWGLGGDGKPLGFRYLPGEGEDERVGAPPSNQGRPGLQVGEDLEVLAPADTDLGELYRLEPYLELRDRGEASHYRLTRGSVLNGLEAGGSREELEGLLRTVCAEPVPAAALVAVEEWVAAYGRFTLEGGLLLTMATPADAEALRQMPEVASCLHARLGPTSFRVVPERAWELVQRLKRAGHLPRVAPSVRLQGARLAAGDLFLLRESLFALRLLRALHDDAQLDNAAEAVRRLETALGPEDAREISRRAQEAVKRILGRGDTGTFV